MPRLTPHARKKRKLAHINNDWQEPHGTRTQNQALKESKTTGIRLNRRKFKFSKRHLKRKHNRKLKKKYRKQFPDMAWMGVVRTNNYTITIGSKVKVQTNSGEVHGRLLLTRKGLALIQLIEDDAAVAACMVCSLDEPGPAIEFEASLCDIVPMHTSSQNGGSILAKYARTVNDGLPRSQQEPGNLFLANIHYLPVV